MYKFLCWEIYGWSFGFLVNSKEEAEAWVNSAPNRSSMRLEIKWINSNGQVLDVKE